MLPESASSSRGQGNSRPAPEIRALNRPVERPADPRDAQLKGVASWARICLGELSLEDAGRQAIITDTFLPDGPDAKIYADLYQEYKHLYTTLKKTHHRLNKIVS